MEQMAIVGAFLAVTAAIELVFAAAVLASGAGGVLHVLLLAAWVAAAAWIGSRYFRRLRVWTEGRLDLTHRLVEGMVGHRTRLAQASRASRDEGLDSALVEYYGLSRTLDRAALYLYALLPRGWLALGLAGLAPAFVLGGPSAARLAIAAGGVLLATRRSEISPKGWSDGSPRRSLGSGCGPSGARPRGWNRRDSRSTRCAGSAWRPAGRRRASRVRPPHRLLFPLLSSMRGA